MLSDNSKLISYFLKEISEVRLCIRPVREQCKIIHNIYNSKKELHGINPHPSPGRWGIILLGLQRP